MRPILVNSKQKIAVLASGLAIATTGLVVTDSPTTTASDPDAQQQQSEVSVEGAQGALDLGATTPGRADGAA